MTSYIKSVLKLFLVIIRVIDEEKDVEIVNNFIIHIDPDVNSWNRAALDLSDEYLKLPSQRLKSINYPEIKIRELHPQKLSTYELNAMALSLLDQQKVKRENL